MGSTFYSLHYHWVCATKERRPFVQPEWRLRLHDYLGGAIRGLGGTSLMVGGVEDHVHALLGLKPSHCPADFIRELKKASSIWTAAHHEDQFQWQEGYSIFTVSASLLGTVRQYIANQEQHHRRRSYNDEITRLLEKHRIQFDPKYLL